MILGPSGAGKSSFLRAGLLPRLRRDDRTFLPMPIVRPERAVLTGELGLAHAIHQLRTDLGLREPMLGEIKNACLASERGAAAGLAGGGPPGRPRPAAGCGRRAARPHPGAAGGSGRGTVQRRRRTRGRALPGAAGRVGRA